MSDPQPTGAFEWTQEPWGRALRCSRLPARHVFTSRDLILRQDEHEWEAVAASLAVPVERLVLIKQVHGVAAAVVRRGSALPVSRVEADIIATDDPSVAIGVRVADCAPVLILDSRLGVAAAAHAGWRGTAAGASPAAVATLHRAFGSRPADLIAAIGPCLGACCGEVGPDVVEAFRACEVDRLNCERNGASDEARAEWSERERRGGPPRLIVDAWFTPGPGDRSFLDLERANHDQLVRAGVREDAIFASGLCTKTHHQRLHSYRAAREQAGRMLAAIRIAAS